jgi:O-antigen/teichoic acid export membrane protein
MVTPFRLMLVFTLLDPIKNTIANLFTALGEPERVAKARGLQLAVLIAGLFTLGPLLRISGVALAVDVMLTVGIVTLLGWARIHVDISLKKLLFAPALALLLGISSYLGLDTLLDVGERDWLTGLVKIMAFSIIYGGTLLVFEYQQLLDMLLFLGQQFGQSQKWPLSQLGINGTTKD